jgi:hypothetical protein
MSPADGAEMLTGSAVTLTWTSSATRTRVVMQQAPTAVDLPGWAAATTTPWQSGTTYTVPVTSPDLYVWVVEASNDGGATYSVASARTFNVYPLVTSGQFAAASAVLHPEPVNCILHATIQNQGSSPAVGMSLRWEVDSVVQVVVGGQVRPLASVASTLDGTFRADPGQSISISADTGVSAYTINDQSSGGWSGATVTMYIIQNGATVDTVSWPIGQFCQ